MTAVRWFALAGIVAVVAIACAVRLRIGWGIEP